jgi:type I restriction enzyme S subunit
MRLAWPLFREQQEIVKRARALDQKRDSEDVSLSKLLSLKQGLMDDLLTGRVRVTNLIEKAA